MANIHHPIPDAKSYEINEFGAIRHVKHKSPVFENSEDETWIKNDQGDRVMVNPKELVKLLFNKDLKDAPLNKFQKEQLKQKQNPTEMKKKESKPKKEKAVKVTKPAKEKKAKEPKAAKQPTVSKDKPSLKEGDTVTFAPRWKKHRTEGQESVTGTIAKIFIGADGNEYAKVKTETKTYFKQTKSL